MSISIDLLYRIEIFREVLIFIDLPKDLTGAGGFFHSTPSFTITFYVTEAS